MDEWTNIPGRALHQLHGDLYNHPQGHPDRRRVHLARPRNDVNHHIPVYNEDGFRVVRRIPTQLEVPLSGALVNLSEVHKLFPPALADNHDPRHDGGGGAAALGGGRAHPGRRSGSTYDAYPLAFTRHYGNVQARRTTQPFDNILNAINRRLLPPIVPAAGVVADNDDDDAAFRGAPIVKGVRAQLYNQISHRVRNQTRFHYVQLGLATTVLAGTSATSAADKRTFEQRKEHCLRSLPHKSFRQALEGPHQPQALRLEQTYVVDVHRLQLQDRSGE